MSLKDKTVSGVGWSAIDSLARYGITFVVSIVLARLLSPDEYGLIGILTIFINLFNVIVDGGFTTALIRKKNASDDDYCTVFYINLVVSFLLAAVLFLCAQPIATFFERTELVLLTRVMASIVIINALGIVQKARLTKQINFRLQTKISIISSIASGVIGIFMAYAGFEVWALVGQQVSNQFISTVMLWLSNKWLPKLIFSWSSFNDLWSFGWKLLISGVIGSLSDDIYQAVIGKSFSPQSLGYYSRAHHFTSIFSSNITTIVKRVSFPVLSTLQDDPVRLKEGYRRVIKITMLPTFVLMLGLAAVAKPLILVLLGEKWLTSVSYLQIICLYAMMNPLHALNLNAIHVVGRSDLTLKLKIIKTFLSLIPISLGIFLNNIYYMLLGSLFINYFAYFLNTYYSGPLLNYMIIEQIKDVLPSFRIALLMAIPVYGLSFISINEFVLLPLQLLIGFVMVFVLCESFKLPEYLEIKQIIIQYLKKVKTKRNY